MTPPNRSIDVEVAEKVMNWTPFVGKDAIAALAPLDDWQKKNQDIMHFKRIWMKGEERMACEECGDMPQFSSSISDAFAVVDRVMSKGFGVSVSGVHGKFTCQIIKFTPDVAGIEQEWIADDDTAPLVICRASLSALEKPQ